MVTYEQLYTTIKECHQRVGHHGHDKAWREVVFCTETQNENHNFISFEILTATKKCPCKAAKVPCGTKYNPAKKKSCTDISM